MALQVVLQAPPDQLKGLLLTVLALIVDDEPLHRQRLAVVRMLLEHLHSALPPLVMFQFHSLRQLTRGQLLTMTIRHGQNATVMLSVDLGVVPGQGFQWRNARDGVASIVTLMYVSGWLNVR